MSFDASSSTFTSLTDYGQPGLGTDQLVVHVRSHLALVFGVILERDIHYPQIVDALTTVTEHRIPWISRYALRKPCWEIE